MTYSVDDLASPFARVALQNIQQEYPNKLDHVMNSAEEVAGPRKLHPVFYGSFDWHSSVHMHWLLVRLLRIAPRISERKAICSLLDEQFTPENIRTEIGYLDQPSRQSFERTYGWAWLLKLQAELHLLSQATPSLASWTAALQPLADAFSARFMEFLPMAQFPIRAGTHANSAFGLMLALDYAEIIEHPALKKLILRKAHDWYGKDRRYPAAYGPGGDDFLSGGLIEAALMMRCMDGCSFADWWEVFCPTDSELSIWLTPVSVSNRSDPKLSHHDGLNLSRAWCLQLLSPALPTALKEPVSQAIVQHLDAGMPHTSTGDYVGTHWLASFALLALTSTTDQ